jgi:hypothetical protein
MNEHADNVGRAILLVPSRRGRDRRSDVLAAPRYIENTRPQVAAGCEPGPH